MKIHQKRADLEQTSISFNSNLDKKINYQNSQSTLVSLDSVQKGNSFFEDISKDIFQSLTSAWNWFISLLHGSSKGSKVHQIHDLAQKNGFVAFYDHNDPKTSFLGNYYPCTIHFGGLSFKCAEAVFQAMKFKGTGRMEEFQNLTGHEAWSHARTLTRNWNEAQRDHWRSGSYELMKNILYAKFTQNPELRDLLLETGSAYLVEHAPVKGRDRYWADDHDGTGENRLGKALQETRSLLGGKGAITPPTAYWNYVKTR